MKKILLVEDDAGVIEFITKGLGEQGFELAVAFNGEAALKMASESTFDLFVLDIMLPGMNGMEVCRQLREKKINTPILFLTALGTAENIAMGLNLGADDYLVKPFKFIELSARINALLRRGSTEQPHTTPTHANIYTLADLRVDDDAKTVTRANTEVTLTATEYRLLLVLIRNKGKVLSRVDLLEAAWDINVNIETNVVDVYINYLRKKLDNDPDVKLIHTVVGMGYVMKEK